jgi:hypothetical protein
LSNLRAKYPQRWASGNVLLNIPCGPAGAGSAERPIYSRAVGVQHNEQMRTSFQAKSKTGPTF